MLTGQEVPGRALDLVFELLDHYGRRVKLSPFKALVLTGTSKVRYRGNDIALLNRGFFYFTGVIVYAQPGVTHTLQANT